MAVFDVVTVPGQTSPLILHQPRPTLYDLFPGAQYHRELSQTLLEERTHIGIVDNSFFAMGHRNYPLVSVDYRFSSGRRASTEPADDETSATSDVALRERECTSYGCLVGTHISSDSSSSRLSRLIEGRPSPKLSIEGPSSSDAKLRYPTVGGAEAAPWHPLLLPPPTQERSFFQEHTLQGAVLGLCAILGYVMLMMRRTWTQTQPPPSPTSLVEMTIAVTTPADEIKSPLPSVPFSDIPVVSSSGGSTGGRPADDDFEDGEGEGDAEGGEDVKKKRRRKRGKKKVTITAPVDDSTAADNQSSIPSSAVAVTKAGPASTKQPASESDESAYVVVPSPAPPQPAPTPVLLPLEAAMPAPAQSVPPAPSSLSVTDTVLGE